MALEIRKIETVVGETGKDAADSTETTYELGFATVNGGWVKFVSVPEHVVLQADANAKAAQPDAPPPPDPLPADPVGSAPVDAPATDPPAADTPAY